MHCGGPEALPEVSLLLWGTQALVEELEKITGRGT